VSVYFVDIFLAISRPTGVITAGKLKREVMRRMEVSLPVRDVVRAEQLMDQLARGFKLAFEEIEAHDKSIRQANQADRPGPGDGAGSGDHGQDRTPPPCQEQESGGGGGAPVELDLPEGSGS